MAEKNISEKDRKNIFKTISIFIVLILIIGAASVTYSVLSEQFREDEPLNISNITNHKITGADDEPEKIPAPDFTVLDYEGNEVRLSDYFGKPIVLNFWASWCPPCKAEMPHFNKVYLETRDDVVFFMLNMTDGQRETIGIAKNYIESNGFDFPVFFDTDSSAAMVYHITSIPTTYFIDSEGYVVTGYSGLIDENTLRRSIDMARS